MIASAATVALPRSTTPARDLLARLCAAGADVPAVAEQIGDWTSLLTAAQRHGVLGILEQRCKDHSGILPDDARQRLDELRAVERLWATHLLENLEEALACLAKHAIEVIPLKGPLLAARLHGSPLLRHSSDMDLLVQPENLERALRALADVGYWPDGGPKEAYQRKHLHHVHLQRAGAAPLELHFRAFTGFGTFLPAEVLFKNARPYQTPAGHHCRMPDPEDEYLYLSVHAAGHAFERLAWLCDLQAMLQQSPDLDRAAASWFARSHGLTAAFAFCQEVLQQRLGVPEGQPATAGLRRAARPAKGLRAARRLLYLIDRLPDQSPRTTLTTVLYQAALCDRALLAAGFLCHHLGRVARRRVQRILPGLTPRGWSA